MNLHSKILRRESGSPDNGSGKFRKWKDKKYGRLVERRNKLEGQLTERTDQLEEIRAALNNRDNPITKGLISRKKVGIKILKGVVEFFVIASVLTFILTQINNSDLRRAGNC